MIIRLRTGNADRRAVLLVTAIVAWPLASYGCGDGTMGPCVPADTRSEPALGSARRDEATHTGQALATLGSLGKKALDDAEYILTSPLRMDGTSALILGGVVASIGGLMVVDKDIRKAFQQNRTNTNDDLADSLETIGFGRNVFIANAGFLGAGWLFRGYEEGNTLMRTARVSLESQLFVEASRD